MEYPGLRLRGAARPFAEPFSHPQAIRAMAIRIDIAYANAGGGHRSVARALQAGFARREPRLTVRLVDVLRFTPPPFRFFDRLYPWLIRGRAWPWALVYALTNGPRRAAALSRLAAPLLARTLSQMWAQVGPPALLLSDYPILNRDLARLAQRHRVPFVVLVTDLGTAHASWLTHDAPLRAYLVPSARVDARLAQWGVPAARRVRVGLPVHPAFLEPVSDRAGLRRELGLQPDRPVVLLVGGAEGAGRLGALAQAIAARRPRAQMVVVTGRNARLRQRLAARAWPIPTRVLGFVDDMPRWMHAADLLLTKAGPSTIAEALAVGLPMILTGHLPGQEAHNPAFVADLGAGVYEPDPQRAAALVTRWTRPDDPTLAAMRAAARRSGFGQGTWQVVAWLTRQLGLHPAVPSPSPEVQHD